MNDSMTVVATTTLTVPEERDSDVTGKSPYRRNAATLKFTCEVS
jgi:hypothetical protein